MKRIVVQKKVCEAYVITMLLRTTCISFFSRTPIQFLSRFRPSLVRLSHFSTPTTTTTTSINETTKTVSSSSFSMKKSPNFSTAAAIREPTSPPKPKRSRRKSPSEAPYMVLRKKLGQCSKHGNLAEALRLYDEGKSDNVPLSLESYNSLLYLCSSIGYGNGNGERANLAVERGFQIFKQMAFDQIDKSVEVTNLGVERGFQIFNQMALDRVVPNEATFTSMARLAYAKDDPDLAFKLVKQMKNAGLPPKLRSYGPALFGYCHKGMADGAYEVDAHMAETGIVPEEEEVAALLKLSAEVKRADKVYEMLHRMRTTVRQVKEETGRIVEEWFESEAAEKVGEVNWDAGKVKEGVMRGGGGWHGQGWLGSGKWRVSKTWMDDEGVCQSCKEKLVSIDIDPKETETFAAKLTKLACDREVKGKFLRFQEWLWRHGPFDAVVDGANVGLVNQREFNFFQLNSVVNQLREMSPSKRLPLVILHQSRVNGGPAQHPRNRRLLESWKNAGALYSTPIGSNDDWYWLFAAVSCKCLLVTNDEMRDHLFQMLGTSFFPRWKEKHQVRLRFSRSGCLRMPPPYSSVIQESEQGTWHVPTVVGDDIETPRQWICATRLRSSCS